MTNIKFSEQELLQWGFTWVKDGGMFYLCYDNEDPAKVLVTEDYLTKLPRELFQVYRLNDTRYTHPLTFREVSLIINGGK